MVTVIAVSVVCMARVAILVPGSVVIMGVVWFTSVVVVMMVSHGASPAPRWGALHRQKSSEPILT